MGLKGLLSKSNPKVLGVDISSTAVKIVELSQSGSGYKVESYAVRPLPKGAIADGVIKDPEQVSKVIREAWERCGTKTKLAAVAVSGSSVITKVLEMSDTFSDEQIETQISQDAEQYVSFPIDEIVIDFEVLGPSSREGSVNVLLAACRRDVIEALTDVITEAGLQPEVVDVEVYALARAYEHVADHLFDSDPTTVALFDIGAHSTNLVLIDDGQIGPPREAPFGGHSLTDSIMNRYGLSTAEAGSAKRQGGLPTDYPIEVLEPWVADAVEQLYRVLQVAFTSSPINSVDKVVLTGGGAATEGLAQALETRLGVDVVFSNPFEQMKKARSINQRAFDSDVLALNVAAGLAMWSFINGKH